MSDDLQRRLDAGSSKDSRRAIGDGSLSNSRNRESVKNLNDDSGSKQCLNLGYGNKFLNRTMNMSKGLNSEMTNAPVSVVFPDRKARTNTDGSYSSRDPISNQYTSSYQGRDGSKDGIIGSRRDGVNYAKPSTANNTSINSNSFRTPAAASLMLTPDLEQSNATSGRGYNLVSTSFKPTDSRDSSRQEKGSSVANVPVPKTSVLCPENIQILKQKIDKEYEELAVRKSLEKEKDPNHPSHSSGGHSNEWDNVYIKLEDKQPPLSARIGEDQRGDSSFTHYRPNTDRGARFASESLDYNPVGAAKRGYSTEVTTGNGSESVPKGNLKKVHKYSVDSSEKKELLKLQKSGDADTEAEPVEDLTLKPTSSSQNNAALPERRRIRFTENTKTGSEEDSPRIEEPKLSITTSQCFLSVAATANEEFEKLRLELELLEVEEQIREATKNLVEARQMSSNLKEASEELIRARQNEIAYLEFKFNREKELLSTQMALENKKYSDLYNSLARARGKHC